MVEILAERPFLLTLILMATAGLAAFFWMQSGNRYALIIAGFFLILIPLGIATERVWVTDRESLKSTIQNLASALEREDHDYVFRHIDMDADEAVLQAKAELPRYDFRQVRVNEGGFRKVEVRKLPQHTEAIADFVVNVSVSIRGRGTQANVPRRLIVKFVKVENPQDEVLWKAIEYTHMPIVGKSDGYSPKRTAPQFD